MLNDLTGCQVTGASDETVKCLDCADRASDFYKILQALLCQYRFGHWKLKHEAKTCATIAWGHIKVWVIPSHTCKHLQILGCGRARFWQTIYEDILLWPVSCPHLAFTALFPAFRLEANSCLSFGLCGVIKQYYIILTFATKGRVSLVHLPVKCAD